MEAKKIQLEKVSFENILEYVQRLDFTDIQILRKFYEADKEFPKDTQPYCLPILYQEMKPKLKIGKEGLRKRLESLVKIGLLEKVRGSNPAIYLPLSEKINIVRAIIKKFFILHEIKHFI